MKYLNCDVKVISPMSFVYFENQITEDDFVFVISQSGHSTNCIQALQKLKITSSRSCPYNRTKK